MSEPSPDRSLEEAAPEAEDGPDRVLQYVVDNVPAWIFWKDRNGVYRGCNKSFAALDGKSDPREIIGKTDYELAWKALADGYRAVDQEVMEQGSSVLGRAKEVAEEAATARSNFIATVSHELRTLLVRGEEE